MLKKRLKEDIGILTNTKALVFAALLTALSVAIGWVCKTYFTFGAIRVTFESMPVLLAGMMLGPFAGLAVGVASDLVSCLLSGYGVNPVITVGAGLIGIVSGIIYYNCNTNRKESPYTEKRCVWGYFSVFALSLLYLFDHTSMPLLCVLVITDAHQQNFAGVVLQALHILLFLDLVNRRLC